MAFLLTILNKLKIDTMKKGNINVSVENIFPLIKKFLYMKYHVSELREQNSNIAMNSEVQVIMNKSVIMNPNLISFVELLCGCHHCSVE